MRNYKRFFPLFWSLILLSLIVCICVFFSKKYVILNTTASLPHGFYTVCPGTIKRGDLVAFPIPDSVKPMVVKRGWLPSEGIIIKRMVGLPGDHVHQDAHHFVLLAGDKTINGNVLDTDSNGRPMPKFFFSGTLTENTYYVACPDFDKSFDSRYFGPIKQSMIIGVVRPLWIF